MEALNSVRLEAAAVSQLKRLSGCTGTGQKVSEPGGELLNAKDFLAFIQANLGTKTIAPFNYGEIFFKAEICIILQTAFEQDINVETAEALEPVVKCQVRHLTVSTDGAGQEIHVIYRQGGNSNYALENTRTNNRNKKAYEINLPRMSRPYATISAFEAAGECSALAGC